VEAPLRDLQREAKVVDRTGRQPGWVHAAVRRGLLC